MCYYVWESYAREITYHIGGNKICASCVMYVPGIYRLIALVSADNSQKESRATITCLYKKLRSCSQGSIAYCNIM